MQGGAAPGYVYPGGPGYGSQWAQPPSNIPFTSTFTIAAAPTQLGYNPVGYPHIPIAPGQLAPEIFAARNIMQSGLFHCCDDVGLWLFAYCCPCLVAGSNMEDSGRGSWCYGCCCADFCAGCQRSEIQDAIGVPNAGCPANCVLRLCCPSCALSQEARALRMFLMGRTRMLQASYADAGPSAPQMSSR